MPKIKSYAPSWLKEPEPGHKLFAQSDDDEVKLPPSQFRISNKAKPGPRRTIARRGTEVFVAGGKQIRWGNLAHLKRAWDSKQPRAGFGSRSKLDDLSDSFEIYDEEPESRGHNWVPAEGYRVSCFCPTTLLSQLPLPHPAHRTPNPPYLYV